MPVTFNVCAISSGSEHVNYGAYAFISICNIGPNSALYSTNLNKCWRCESWGFHDVDYEEYCILDSSSPEDGEYSSETSMNHCHTTQRHFPEDSKRQMLTRLKSIWNYEDYLLGGSERAHVSEEHIAFIFTVSQVGSQQKQATSWALSSGSLQSTQRYKPEDGTLHYSYIPPWEPQTQHTCNYICKILQL
jgi:hypothetical protein